MKKTILAAMVLATTMATPTLAADFKCSEPAGTYTITASGASYDNGNSDGWTLENVKHEDGAYTFEKGMLFWTMMFTIPEDGNGATWHLKGGDEIINMNCTKL